MLDWQAWLLATRPKTLAAGIAPVVVGAALVLAPLRQSRPSSTWLLLGLCLLTAILVQIATNFANDACDALSGVDDVERLGPTRACAAGLIRPRSMLMGAGVLLAICLAIAITVAVMTAWPILVLGSVAAVLALAYSGGPWPLSRLGLGDLFVLLFFGLAAVLGTVWVGHGGDWIRWRAQLPIALPVAIALGLQATAILAINNIRDRLTDARSGRRTLAVLLGHRGGRLYHAALHNAAWLCLVLVWWHTGDHRWALPVAIALGGGLWLTIRIWRQDGRSLNACLAQAGGVELATAVGVIGCFW